MTEVSFVDRDAAAQALKDIRSDSNPLNWVVYTYNDKSVLELTASGNGGLDEIYPHLQEKNQAYAFFRRTDCYDGHTTVKFVFVAWSGNRVPVVKRGKMTIHKGSIIEFIGQAHLTVDANTHDEISEDVINQRIQDASGSGSRVMDAVAPAEPAYQPPAQQQQQAPAPQQAQPAPVQQAPKQQQAKPASSASVGRPSVSRQSTGAKVGNQEEATAALNAVRADADPTNWCLFGYQGTTDVVELTASGSDGLGGLCALLKEDQVQYGLYRTTDVYDGHTTVKFVFVRWVGEKVKILRKARIATHKGAIDELIGQFHIDVDCSNLTEINDDIVKERVQFAAGTAVHVK